MKFSIAMHYQLESLPSQLDRHYLLPFTGFRDCPTGSPCYFVASLDEVKDTKDKDQIVKAVIGIVREVYNLNIFDKIEVTPFGGKEDPIAVLDRPQIEALQA